MSPIKKGTRLTEKPKNTMFRVRLDEESLKKLDFLSEKLHTSKSDIVRKGIDEQYEKNG